MGFGIDSRAAGLSMSTRIDVPQEAAGGRALGQGGGDRRGAGIGRDPPGTGPFHLLAIRSVQEPPEAGEGLAWLIGAGLCTGARTPGYGAFVPQRTAPPCYLDDPNPINRWPGPT